MLEVFVSPSDVSNVKSCRFSICKKEAKELSVDFLDKEGLELMFCFVLCDDFVRKTSAFNSEKASSCFL